MGDPVYQMDTTRNWKKQQRDCNEPIGLKDIIESIFFTFIHIFASLQCFIFLISVKDVINLCILDSILTFCGKKYDLSIFSYAWH
jgi:hypothetical protein